MGRGGQHQPGPGEALLHRLLAAAVEASAVRVVLPNCFTPRPYQRGFMRYLDNGGRRAMWVVHRRGGKDLTALHQTCKMAHRRRATYWHVFPTAEQARKAIWEGFTKDGQRIMEQVFPREIRRSPRDFRPSGEMVVELKCGSLWRLLGSDRMEVVGAGPAGVVFSEFALARPKTWDLVRPMLRENDGWAAFITTPRGNNHAKELFDVAGREKGWFRELLTLRQTGAYDYAKTIAEERAEGMPEALIRQEYECDWTAANVGSIWGELLEALEKSGAVSAFLDSGDECFTTWDLGGAGAKGDATCFWVWRPSRGGGVDVLDFYESNGKPLSHYFDVVKEKVATHGYRFAKHWLPHDARAKSLQTGLSTVEQCATEWGMGKVAIAPEMGFADGLQAARWLLQRPVRFHSRCEDGVEALKAYHRDWDDDRKCFTDKPVHDWSSHAADAWRYVACVAKASEGLLRKPEAPKPPPARDVKSFAMDELWDIRGDSHGTGRI